MEKKNTILLTVIAVATLLVAVVGATFAYFTAASTAGDDNETAATGTTTTVGGVNLVATSASTDNDIAYPGGYVVAGVKVDATNSDAKNSYDTTFNVVGKVTNNTGTVLNWKLYEVPASIADPVTGCSRQEDDTTDPGNTRYWYTGCTLAEGIDADATAIAQGTIAANATDSEIKTTTKEKLTIAASKTTTTFYYLVVEYPNNTSADQTTTDAGKTITAQITNVTEPSSAVTQ